MQLYRNSILKTVQKGESKRKERKAIENKLILCFNISVGPIMKGLKAEETGAFAAESSGFFYLSSKRAVRAWRSIFPFALRGMASNTLTRAGTM